MDFLAAVKASRIDGTFQMLATVVIIGLQDTASHHQSVVIGTHSRDPFAFSDRTCKVCKSRARPSQGILGFVTQSGNLLRLLHTIHYIYICISVCLSVYLSIYLSLWVVYETCFTWAISTPKGGFPASGRPTPATARLVEVEPETEQSPDKRGVFLVPLDVSHGQCQG